MGKDAWEQALQCLDSNPTVTWNRKRENESATIMATKRLADLVVNLRNHAIERIHDDFETLVEVQNRGISGPTKGANLLQKLV